MSINEQHDELLPPGPGYDRASSWYENWHWTEFWRRNEIPITSRLMDALPRGLALDAGSGTGLYRLALQARGIRTIALDISPKMLEVQRAKLGGNRADLIQGDIQTLPPSWRESFSSIVCARVLSHIENLDVAFANLANALRRGGRIILTDVDPEHPYTHVTVKNGVVYSRIRVFKHSHTELLKAIGSAGLEVISQQRFNLGGLTWKPDKAQFGQIYSCPKASIFFVYELVKR